FFRDDGKKGILCVFKRKGSLNLSSLLQNISNYNNLQTFSGETVMSLRLTKGDENNGRTTP
ncbi:MAG: hypothetical protein AB1422_15190, partial [bacterium]